MRLGAAALIAGLAALVGAGAAVFLSRAVGDDAAGVTTVLVQPTVGSGTTAVEPPPLATTGGFSPASIYASRSPGVVTIYADLPDGARSQGSGFVVDRRGTIMTNAHVITTVGTSTTDVRRANRLFVEFKDGERVPAKIVGWDLFSDVGVVTVDPKAHALRPLPLGDSAGVVVGTPVAAIGSPFGNQSSLAVGVVSATGRSIPSLTSTYEVADAIQVDAPINRGNSGGPLLDGHGEVIGINAQIRSDSGTAEGVGFAIPINVARRSLEQLRANGRVVYAYIGIETQDVTPGIADRLGFGADRGALVAKVKPGSPAQRAGLKGGSRAVEVNGLDLTAGGDLVVRIGSQPVRSAEDVSRIVTYELLPGQKVPFVVLREGKRRETVNVTLGERPPAGQG